MGLPHPAGLSCHFVVKAHKKRLSHLCRVLIFLDFCKFLLTFSQLVGDILQNLKKDKKAPLHFRKICYNVEAVF